MGENIEGPDLRYEVEARSGARVRAVREAGPTNMSQRPRPVRSMFRIGLDPAMPSQDCRARQATPAMELLLIDSEQPEFLTPGGDGYLGRLHELLCLLICRVVGSGASSMPFRLAVARGASLAMADVEPHERNLYKWAAELNRLMQCLTQSERCAEAGLLALGRIPPDTLLSLERIIFITPMGGRSVEQRVVAGVCEGLARVGARCEVELVMMTDAPQGSMSPSIPTELILLQSEHNLTTTLLDDALSTSRWVSAQIAQRQVVRVELCLGAERLTAVATPALLHEEGACDVRACMCHSAPLSSRLTRTGPTGMGGRSRPRCPLSQLELDARDVQRMGTVGHFTWPGSLAKAAANAGVTCFFSEDRAPGATRLLCLEAKRRVRLADLSLSSVYGSPWLLEAGGAPDSDEGALLGGLASALTADAEALVCQCTARCNFDDESQLPANLRALLQSQFVLMPQTPPGTSLLLKCIGTAAQIMPRPSSAGGMPEAVMARAREQAASMLAAVPLEDEFNPLFHCPIGGGAQALAHLLSATHSSHPPAAPAHPSAISHHHGPGEQANCQPRGCDEPPYASAPMGYGAPLSIQRGQAWATAAPMQNHLPQGSAGRVSNAGPPITPQPASLPGWMPGMNAAKPSHLEPPSSGPPSTLIRQRQGRRKMQRITAIGGQQQGQSTGGMDG